MKTKTKTVAYLGPTGSNSDLALRELIAPDSSMPCLSIAEVFRSVESGEADSGLVPIDNLVHGPVTETLDLLLEYKGRVHIDSGFIKEIKNALGILADKGAKVDKIKRVYSHPQPLQQCAKYLRAHFASAEMVPSASTSAAVKFVKDQTIIDAAVIGAPQTLAAEGFAVIENDISDLPGNKTRFILIKQGGIQAAGLSAPGDKPGDKLEEKTGGKTGASKRSVTLFSIVPGKDRQGILFEILNVISVKHRINLLSIHSRPDTKGGFVFHFDIEGHWADRAIAACFADLEKYCTDATGETAEIVIFGSYERLAYHQTPFDCIGIIGGDGKMGRWFQGFFENSGYQVLIHDLNTKLSLKELVEKSDIIMLSLPMSAVPQVAKEISGMLRPGQLVVENCSIKSAAIPHLLDLLPEGVEVLGIHTMFASDVTSINGENVVVTRTARSGKRATAFEDLLYKFGAKISQSNADEHDRIVAFVQGLIQFAIIGLADALHRSVPNEADLDLFSTPNFRNVFKTVIKVLGQDDQLIVDLQTKNKLGLHARNLFLEAVVRLSSALNHGNEAELIKSVEASREFLKRRLTSE